MPTTSAIPPIRSGLRTAWCIWAALLTALPLYLTIAALWGDSLRVALLAGASVIALRTTLYLAALATFPVINLLRRKMIAYPAHARRRHAGHRQPPDATARYTRIVVVSLVLAESIGLWGMLLFLLGDDLQTLALFCGLSALALLLYRPKANELESVCATSGD